MKCARDNYGPSSSSSGSPHRTGTNSPLCRRNLNAFHLIASGMSQRPAVAATITTTTTRVPTTDQQPRFARILPEILSEQRPYPLPALHRVSPAHGSQNAAACRPKHKLSLGLGVNEHTGRVQWCPGFTCYKLFVLIPVVMLPLALVLILLMRMDGKLLALHLPGGGSGGAHSEEVGSSPDYDYYGFGDDPREPPRQDLRLAEELKRCMALHLGSTEELNLDAHQILKDVRTSFRPSDDIVQMPRECLNVMGLEDAKDINVLDESDDKALRRRPRHSPFKQSERGAENAPVAAEISRELEEKDVSGVYEDSATFQSFWNAHGTREALRTAQGRVMHRYMDTSVDPCVDFYKYACGNWEHLHPIPKDKAGFDTFEMLRESLDLVLKQLLEENDPSATGVAAARVKEVKSNQFHTQPAGGNADLTKSSPVAGDALDSANDSKREMLDEKAARLRRHIVQHRRDLSRILLRFKRQNTNSKRKRLVAFNPQLGRAKQNAAPPLKAHHARQKAKFLYQSCTNTEVLAQRGIEPLLKLIDGLGGWPVLDPDWREDHFDWLNLTVTLRQYNNDILIAQWVGPDIKNSDENIIQFDQTSLGLPTREYYLQPVNEKYLHAYQVYMGEVMQKLGAPAERAQLTAQQLIAFETQLASITSPAEQRLNVTKLYKRLTLRQLHESVPAIDWTRYLTMLQQRRVLDHEQVVIYATDYMNDLVNLLSLTEPPTVANYLMWRFVRHRISNVDDRFEAIKQNFFHTLFGREESPSRWKVCIAQVNTNMGMALGAMFVQRYFDESSKADTLSMTHELQQSFREILQTTDWLDDTTKRLAEEKVNAMSLKIGYPDFILNEAELDEKYAGIEIHPDRYFENTLNVLLHTALTEQRKLFEPVNKTTWQTAPAIVNAYYSRNKNQIMFPAGILQPPFYHRHFPRSLNFGGIGVVIGHELTHGFDDKGRLFDRNGNIHKWWTNAAIAGFDERARCIIDQYNNYTVGEVGISLNGESTQGENIADNGGIRQAFHAYKRWLSENPSAAADERLPGLNMTGEQLFFLNFGQVWCGAMRPEAVRNKLNTAIHSPGRFRVIGTVSNSPDFAREFQCPVGSPMNPERKCAVW